MGDFQRCWLRTTHEQHGWTEVDGKAVPVVDSSTVLQGAKYHLCVGVPDVSEPGGLRLAGRDYNRPYETVVVVEEQVKRNSRIQLDGNEVTQKVERKVTIEAVYERVVIETPWVEVQRRTCFCCSCDENSYGGLISDPACRNHGFAATRPCEKHGTPGSVWGDEVPELEGQMPDSVQVVRQIQAELRAVDNS